MIRSFRTRGTADVYDGVNSRAARRICPSAVWAVARRKLDMLDVAEQLDDLRTPPASRLEALSGDRRGQHSIRINDQYRVCFVWTPDGPTEVDIVDYH